MLLSPSYRKFKFKLLSYAENLQKSFGRKKDKEFLYWLLLVSCFSSLVCPCVNCPIFPPSQLLGWDGIQSSELLWFLPWWEGWRPCQYLAFSPIICRGDWDNQSVIWCLQLYDHWNGMNQLTIAGLLLPGIRANSTLGWGWMSHRGSELVRGRSGTRMKMDGANLSMSRGNGV